MKETTMMSLYWKYRDDAMTQNGDKAIVWMEVGSFMEQYAPCHPADSDDVIWKVARLINYNVQQKNKNDTSSAWFLGFPKPSLDKCLEILTSNGYTIYLAEQQCPMISGKLMQRPISRIVTPGTYYERASCSRSYNICCIHTVTSDVHHICVLDTTIGDVRVLTTRNEDELRWFVSVHDPVEVVWLKRDGVESVVLRNLRVIVKRIDRHPLYFDDTHQRSVLFKVYETEVVANGTASDIKPVLVCMFDYLTICHEKILKSISVPVYQVANRLAFHNNALLQLDVVSSTNGRGLLSIVDFTSTQMGKRLLKTQLLNPHVVVDDIVQLHMDSDRVDVEWATTLKRLPDMDRLIRRLDLQLFTVAYLKQLYDACKLITQLELKHFVDTQPAAEFVAFVDHRIDFESERIREGFDPQCDEYLTAFTCNLKALELEVDRIPLKFNGKSLCKIDRSDKEYFVYTASKKITAIKSDPLYACKSNASSTRITSPQLTDLCAATHDSHVVYHQYMQQAIRNMFDDLCTLFSSILKRLSAQVAQTDTLVSRRVLEGVSGFNRATIVGSGTDGSFVSGKGVKHPIVNHLTTYVGNDVSLNEQANGVVVYGLNGAGKSTYGKSVALNIILAQSGFPVCADEFTLKPFTQLFARINCDDNLYDGQSSFQVEINELNTILMFSDDRSFIIADELCKGTEHSSAIALVTSTIIDLLSKNVKFIFASHLHEIQRFVATHSEYAHKMRCKHMSSHFDHTLQTIIYDRTLADGSGDDLYGVEVAKYMMARHCPSVIYNAFKIRKQYEREPTTTIGAKCRYNAKKHKTQCERCSRSDGLDTHHIVPQKEFNQHEKHKMNHVSNLMTLCKPCHVEHHNGRWNIVSMDTPNGKSHLIVEK
jgi:DNA mismatch repair protein MutS